MTNTLKSAVFRFLKVYGLNAVLGFGLGVAIVFLSFTLLGRYGLKEPSPQREIPPTPGHLQENVSSGALETTPSDQSQPSPFPSEPLKNARFTLLLVGMDNRPGEEYLSNTDSLIVASIDQVNQRITFLSIPRDTQVEIPGYGIQKINAAARLQKGLPSTRNAVQNLIGIPIDGYVMTNFNGFKEIIDTLGGITVTVEKDMHYDTGDRQDRYINLKKGTQRLTGTQALQYARFRNDELADISRTARQQEVLKAIWTEATQLKNLPKIPFILQKVYKAVQTDLTIGQIWSLAALLTKNQAYTTLCQTLPGSFAIERGVSYWKVNTNYSKRAVSQLFYEGKTTPVFIKPTQALTTVAKPSDSVSAEGISEGAARKIQVDEKTSGANNNPGILKTEAQKDKDKTQNVEKKDQETTGPNSLNKPSKDFKKEDQTILFEVIPELIDK